MFFTINNKKYYPVNSIKSIEIGRISRFDGIPSDECSIYVEVEIDDKTTVEPCMLINACFLDFKALVLSKLLIADNDGYSRVIDLSPGTLLPILVKRYKDDLNNTSDKECKDWIKTKIDACERMFRKI